MHPRCVQRAQHRTLELLASDDPLGHLSGLHSEAVLTEFEKYVGYIGELLVDDEQASELSKLDPLVFWKAKQYDYSHLAFVARHLLSIHATSSDVEGLFSLAGRVIPDARTRLAPATAQKVVLMPNWILQDPEFARLLPPMPTILDATTESVIDVSDLSSSS